jgi:hypothetical protein
VTQIPIRRKKPIRTESKVVPAKLAEGDVRPSGGEISDDYEEALERVVMLLRKE